MFIIGEIFSFCAAIFLCYSTFAKDKHKMVCVQVMDTICCALSNLFLMSYSGFITSLFSTTRNILESKNKNNKVILTILCLILCITGVIFNNKEWIGLLPVVASIEYTIVMFNSKSSQSLRYGLIINLIMWSIYDLYIKAYPMFLMDLIIASTSSINAYRYKILKNIK